MRRFYLGKILLRWCDNCHIPVLGHRCGCGADTREVAITPPGDVRPAFQADIDHINRIFTDHFNSPLIPEGHLVLLNKAPDADRMEEIILGGAVIGAIRYIPEKQVWEPIPRIAAAAYMKPSSRVVKADEGAVESIKKGASLLAPGLISIDSSVAAGDEVFITDPSGMVFGVGRAKVDAETARNMNRGVIVRTRRNAVSSCVPGEATWNDAVSGNRHILDKKEGEAIRFVRDVAGSNALPANVSYSGGKDSLATLLVVIKALGPVPLLFSDTGVEFPETYENIEVVAARYGLEVVRTGSKETFWDAVSREGPPAVDARWCCKELKLLPVRDCIANQWDECLSFIGQRKYESLARKNSPRVWRNGYIPNQLSAAPLQHWTALHVWLYLFREQAPHNPLYERRIDRIGCFMCPSSDMAVLETIKGDHPDLWTAWSDFLSSWQESHELPAEWNELGLWRHKGETHDENSGNT